MVETGFIMPLWLSLAAILLSFLTAMIIYFRGLYKEGTLTLLMLLSLLLFAKNILFILSAFDKNTSSLYNSLFEAGEFVLLVLIFRGALQKSLFKEWINYLLVAFLSVVITLHATKTNTDYILPIALTESSLLVLFSVLTLLILIRNQFMFIFHSSLFWIAGGTLFYMCMILAAEAVARNGWFVDYKESEKQLLLAAFGIMRLIFYLIAALIKQSSQQEDEWNYFKNSSRE